MSELVPEVINLGGRMTASKEVSEKSLELNVCAELLQHIRSWPGCQRALWFGLTQAQERQTGLDVLLRNAPGFAFMLQFKAPWPSSSENDLYKFSINEQQHEALERLASQNPDAVHYVFPLYSSWDKAERHAPDLVQDTWLVPIVSMPLASLTSLSSPTSGRHTVELIRGNPQMTVIAHSPDVLGRAVNAKEYFGERSAGLSLDVRALGVQSDRLREWIASWDEKNFSLRFRGLHALYVPQG